MKSYKPSAYVSACILLLNVARYNTERERSVSRVRFSDKAFRKMVARKRLHHGSFLSDLRCELLELGWVLVVTASSFALVQEDTVDGWNLVSSKRVSDIISKQREGDLDFDDYEEELESVTFVDDSSDT